MEIYQNRVIKNDTTTISNLQVEDHQFFILEDKDRGLRSDMTLAEIKKIKVMHQTAIPTGRYRILYTYSPKFKKWTLQLMDVKGFDGIRIHAGISAQSTSGCTIPGLKTNYIDKVFNSSAAVKQIEDLILPKLQKNEEVYINIS